MNSKQTEEIAVLMNDIKNDNYDKLWGMCRLTYDKACDDNDEHECEIMDRIIECFIETITNLFGTIVNINVGIEHFTNKDGMSECPVTGENTFKWVGDTVKKHLHINIEIKPNAVVTNQLVKRGYQKNKSDVEKRVSESVALATLNKKIWNKIKELNIIKTIYWDKKNSKSMIWNLENRCERPEVLMFYPTKMGKLMPPEYHKHTRKWTSYSENNFNNNYTVASDIFMSNKEVSQKKKASLLEKDTSSFGVRLCEHVEKVYPSGECYTRRKVADIILDYYQTTFKKYTKIELVGWINCFMNNYDKTHREKFLEEIISQL